MKEKWLYDMTDAENAMKSLSKFLNIGKRELFRFMFTRANEDIIDYDKFYEELIEEFDIDIDKLSIDNIEIKSIHVTTGSDNGYSIKEKGLLNLQEALTQDTPLRNFLLKRDIRIDVENKLLYFRDKKLLIVDDTSGHKDNKNYVYNKLYKDCEVNGFACDEAPLEYGGDVANRPEFFYNLGIMLRYRTLEEEWKMENRQCYIVEYKYPHEKLAWFTLILNNEDEDEIEEDRECYVKAWLIRQSMTVLVYDIKRWGKPEIISYLKLSENIPSHDIINVIDATEERDSLR
ncbi:hypothetical protein [Clostridium sp.]|uniref:hypothetical protein n=1 Tax=Clostridium sp. TaxID=1506 RepID=UPI001D6DC5CE|nr:hypothetical protein [Clostridium sp.]MBS5985278.1 hypothetical protein [Clostridium sp.]